MDTAASLAAGLTTTPPRGWLVVLLSRLQGSSVVLISYSFGIFLPFISEDLHLSPLEAGLLQSAWWVTSAVLALPCSVWFSRFRPVPLVLVSLWLGLPFLVLQGLATNFLVLFLARFFFVLCHVISTPARPLLLQQWAAPSQYALLNAVSLSLHSVLLATAISTSAWLITAAGSWRLVYGMLSAFLLVQTLTLVGGGAGGARTGAGSHARARGATGNAAAGAARLSAGLACGRDDAGALGDVDGHRHVSPHAPAGAARHASRAERATPWLFVLRADSVRAPWRGARKTGHSAARSSSGCRRSVIRSLASC